MIDERLKTLAKNLVCYSVDVQKGENILIEGSFSDTELVHECIKQVYARGGFPFYNFTDPSTRRVMALGATTESIERKIDIEAYRMNKMDGYIGIRGGYNSFEMEDVSPEAMKAEGKFFSKVHHDIRVKKTKWVVLRYPTPSFAQMAGMSTERFEDFYFNVCCLDYSKMDKAMQNLKTLMERTDKVRILDAKTDLRFSIKGQPAIPCAGKLNIPDGEVYSAPIKNSVEGYIQYSAPSIQNGVKHDNIRLEFEKGKIVKATSSNTEAITQVFDTDEGARYVGEFAIGVNPYVTKPMLDTLFDEKIAGSIHFTPGACYDECPNGNNSAIHWDIVHIQTPEYGGGEIYFDDVLIRKDGMFVLPELYCLNPENLK
ncbi:MAG: aminopeptidase [Clostridia bacterium]